MVSAQLSRPRGAGGRRRSGKSLSRGASIGLPLDSTSSVEEALAEGPLPPTFAPAIPTAQKPSALFGDEEGESGGGLFGGLNPSAPASKAPNPTPPKPKKGGLFDDDDDDDASGGGLFGGGKSSAAPAAASKPAAKKKSLFDDDDD